MENVPFQLQPVLLSIWTAIFFLFARPARRAVVQNLAVVLPGSSRWMNHLRAFRTLLHYAQTIADGASYRVKRAEFDYEIEGAEFLEQLRVVQGGIVLTAHMGNYDLGAALFAQKFQRELFMVRAPERDAEAGAHLSSFVQETGRGAVKIAYNQDGAHIAFDLLNALRRGEVISIQGDRGIPGLSLVAGEMFGAPVDFPAGPFTLAQVTGVPIFPLFIVRRGYHRYRIIVRPPLRVERAGRSRDAALAAAAADWSRVLEEVIAQHWAHWFAFTPVFKKGGA